MRLIWSSTSPFVRKVIVFALETGLDHLLDRVPTKTMPTNPDPDLTTYNPLAKMPTLELDPQGGNWLYDSRIICEYLDTLHDRAPLVPSEPPARFDVLRLAALADGALDAGILCRYESLRPEPHQWPAWTEAQLGKVHRTLDVLESAANPEAAAKNVGPLTANALNLGQIAVGCLLGWLDFRLVAGDFRKSRPHLTAWYARFAERPSMRATVPYE